MFYTVFTLCSLYGWGGVPPSPEGKKEDRVLRGRTGKSTCFKGTGAPYSVLFFFIKKNPTPLQKDAMIGFRQKVARWKAMDLSISEHPKILKSVKGSRS